MKNMLKIFLAFALAVQCMPAFAAEKTDYKEIFEKDRVIDVEIKIDEADLSDMRDYAQNEEYHAADVTIDGVTVENVGIRTKGNMTLNSVANSDSDKYSYRIKFDKYVKNQTLLGLDELCLNDGYSDSSYMREYLHYEILREIGMNVPETVFCNVSVNGEAEGLYLAVEGLDDTFLEDNFGENYKNGNFYKMDEGASLSYKEDENYTYADLKVGTDTDLSSFKEFVKKLNDVTTGEKGDIESFLNVDSALKYIASNTVLCNYDSYNGNMHHNYYLYEDESGVFTVVPWDFNMSFGRFGGGGNDATIGIDEPIASGSMEELPLINKLLSVEEYKEKYYGYIKEMMEILENFEERVGEVKSIIKPYVEEDVNAGGFYTLEQFESATTKQEETQGEEMPQTGEKTDKKEEKGKGFGGMLFGSGKSIINCVSDRLANLKEQFAGTAVKTTESKGFGGRGMPSEMNESVINDVIDRLTKLKEQLDGAATGTSETEEITDIDLPFGIDKSLINTALEKLTELKNRLGSESTAEGGGERPDGNMAPPDFGGDGNMAPPENHSRGEKPGFFGGANRADLKLRINVNGHILTSEKEPYIKDGTTLIDARAFAAAIGATVDISEDTLTLTSGTKTIVFTKDSNAAYVDGEEKTLSKAPEYDGANFMIPLRFTAEELKMKVEWVENTKLVTVTAKKQ